NVIRLILTEGPRFPAVAEFYYREVVAHVIAVLRGLAQRAVERGELPNDSLVRFPQLLAAPGIVAIIWSGLFDRWAKLDAEAFMRAYLDLIFGKGRAV
ncbi:MAG: TetR/AcrR family transcriptional regulator C-terminal domain-containing protein, partial [Xanthobacteraceae bacterium]